MRANGNNNGQRTGQPAFSGSGLSAGDIALRRHRVASGTGVVPPRRRPGLPTDRVRTGQTKTQSRPVSRSRASSGWLSRHGSKVLLAFVTLLVLVAAVSGVVRAYRSFVGSELFTLRQVEVNGAVRASREELTQMLRQKVGRQSLWQVDLVALRNEVLRYAWVREARVERVLPDTLRVTLSERDPFALMRRANGSVVWVDREGIVLGERTAFKNLAIPPIISGLEEGEGSAAANRQRLNVYQQLLNELDKEEPKLSDKVDEINLDDVSDVRLRLVERKISVLLGEINFRARLEAALKILDAVDRKDVAALNLLNVSDAERIVNGGRVAYLRAVRDDRVIVGMSP